MRTPTTASTPAQTHKDTHRVLRMTKSRKVVDYRAANLAWLLDFKDRVVNKELEPETELVVVQEDNAAGEAFTLKRGETLCVVETREDSFVVSRPYGAAKTGEVSRSSVKVKSRNNWTTEDVAEYVVKRACLKTECTYLELIKSKKHVSKKQYKGAFVSQARRCKFVDLVAALQDFYERKNVDPTKQFVWLDLICANQPKLTATDLSAAARQENERQLTEGLHVAIANFEERVMFMDKWDGATALKRAWCVWEVFGVAKAKKQLEIALPPREYDRYISFMVADFWGVTTKLSKIDVEKAECHSEDDLEMIQSAIQSQSSFVEVNEIVMSQLRLWVASTAVAEMEKEEKKQPRDEYRIGLMATCAGLTYKNQGQLERSEKLLRKALSITKKMSGEENPETATCLNNLAVVLMEMDKLEEAEPMQREALRIDQKSYGKYHPDIGRDLSNLGRMLQAKGEFEEAEAHLQEALEIFKKEYGQDHPSVAVLLNNLAKLLMETGELEEAKPLLDESLGIREKAFGKEHPTVAETLNNMAQLMQQKKDTKKAASFGKEALRIAEKCLGRGHPTTQSYRSAWS